MPCRICLEHIENVYRIDAIIDSDVLQAVKAIPDRVDPAMGRYVQQVVRPAVQSRVNQTFAVYPGPVVRPFQFATEKSRRAYFATKGFGKGLPYHRTNELQRGWKVEVDRRKNSGFISIRNTAPAAVYVIGGRQVPGHRRTGWGEHFDAYTISVSEYVIDLLITGWVETIDNLLQQ